MLVVRNGFIVKESQTVISKTNEKQLIYSVTKSVLSALYGIAVSEGKIGLDERVLDILGERSIVDEAAKDKITIRHLLTMTSGLNWPELAGNYYGPESVSRQMMRSQNWVQFILKRPMRIEPGISYNYSSADSHLLSAVLQARTGQTVYDYAKTKLFEPLGIHNTQWDQDPQGITSGHSGLYLTPLDMAKFGYLYLHQGTWDGKQVVPQNWIMESTTVHSGGDYGYQWRVDEAGNWVARGFAGQYIFVSPKTNIVAVFTGVLPANKESVPIYLFSDYILKSVINQNN
jgi:CubicO group peptidase (beta-lactamase class C family)